MTSPSTAHVSAEVPSNIYKPNAPLEARVIKHERLTAPDSSNDVRHIVFDISGSELHYVEGQSIGILPPGTDETGKPHKLRLYSIASPAVGDDGAGKTVSLCVKRAITIDSETGKEYHGVCSSYLCDLKVGESSKLTGPVGKSFLIPDTPDANLIMIATGTGIAPFRAFLHNRYNQRKNEKGQAWVFFGAQTRKDYLYAEEMAEFAKHDTCHIVTAFSREEKNPQGGRMYVQHRLAEHGATLFNLLKQPQTYLYICGLRGMESGIIEGLQEAATQQGIDWNQFFEQLKAEKRWHVEVY
ncbi:MAG TPA: ferredoxin-NADP reductase [Coleofasciculaceae cyanobacterium]|jgi:ferredoxin--NADP+ reductase